MSDKPQCFAIILIGYLTLPEQNSGRKELMSVAEQYITSQKYGSNMSVLSYIAPCVISLKVLNHNEEDDM